MTHIDIKAVARRTWEEIFPAVDDAALAEVVADDCINHEGPEGDSTASQGLAGARRVMHWLGGAFTEQRYDIHRVLADEDTVAVYLTYSGRHTGEFMGMAPTGRRFAAPAVHIVRFENGKGAEHWAVRDDATMMRQLGGEPARPV